MPLDGAWPGICSSPPGWFHIADWHREQPRVSEIIASGAGGGGEVRGRRKSKNQKTAVVVLIAECRQMRRAGNKYAEMHRKGLKRCGDKRAQKCKENCSC